MYRLLVCFGKAMVDVAASGCLWLLLVKEFLKNESFQHVKSRKKGEKVL